MKKELREEIFPSIIMLVLDFMLYLNASEIKPKINYDIGSGGFPKLLTIIIAVLLLMRIALSVMRILHKKKSGVEEESTSVQFDTKNLICGAGTITLLGVYTFLFKSVGFIVTSIVYLFLQQLLFAPPERDHKSYLLTITAVSVILPVVVYFVFVYGLHVMLPKGILRAVLP